jgi:mannose-6-phosphate isomerase class I
MSFMFHPYPYNDPDAINHVAGTEEIRSKMVSGLIAVAKTLVSHIKNGQCRIGIDGYPGAQFDALINVINQQLGDMQVRKISAHSLLKDKKLINAMLKAYLPKDYDIDPVLLYGVRYEGGYEGFQDSAKVSALKHALMDNHTAIIVYGRGALCSALRDTYDLRIWFDITPKQAVLNTKYGKVCNLGTDEPLPYAAMMRRNYYCDFEMAMGLRWELIRSRKIDFYISGDDPEKMNMLPYLALKALFDKLLMRPLRCRPVYLEGVWGGFYFKRLRHLPEGMRNCAWVFDLIPLEVSLAVDMSGKQLEVPFFTFVQVEGEKLLGEKAYEQFGGYFPVRFNYDDTYHSNGNMSIQCHPDADYAMKNYKELGGQDESYYVCIAGQEACTYLGFREKGDCEKFLTIANKVAKSGELMDYQQYLNAIPSKPGMQLMIPAGTIHASGRNQVVLEIGSLTVGSYTYKLYDYQRIDPQTGLPRPLHLKMGEKVLHSERTAEWINENLVNHGRVVREGKGYQETIVGEHELLYFSLRNLTFEKEIFDDTNGTFHVLALVDGERVRVESIQDTSLFYVANSMDILIVPAYFGRYRIINEGVGKVVVHKTCLKG